MDHFSTACAWPVTVSSAFVLNTNLYFVLNKYFATEVVFCFGSSAYYRGLSQNSSKPEWRLMTYIVTDGQVVRAGNSVA